MATTRSSYDSVAFAPSDQAREGSFGLPGVPAAWNRNFPEVATEVGFESCTAVLKNEPKFPGVEPTTVR
jgi:hypothetical protein